VVAGSGAPSRAAVPVEVLVVWSFVYLALRRVLALMVLRWRSAAANEVEVLVPARSRLPAGAGMTATWG
jgi:hypothetical protein